MPWLVWGSVLVLTRVVHTSRAPNVRDFWVDSNVPGRHFFHPVRDRLESPRCHGQPEPVARMRTHQRLSDFGALRLRRDTLR